MLQPKRKKSSTGQNKKVLVVSAGFLKRDEATNVIKKSHKMIRSFQSKTLRLQRLKLSRIRKSHCIAWSARSTKEEKKIACLPIREIERDILEFNGEELTNIGFEYKANRNKYILQHWMTCQCRQDHSNMITHRKCIISSFIQSFILGALCLKYDAIQKDLGTPNRKELMKRSRINEESLMNLLLRIKYQSLRVNIESVRFDLWNRTDKYGYLTITPSIYSSRPHIKPHEMHKILFQQHDALCILRSKRSPNQLFFGIALYQSKRNVINIKCHHRSIAIYDVYDKNEEWMLYAAPYCVRHALLSLFQISIDKQNK